MCTKNIKLEREQNNFHLVHIRTKYKVFILFSTFDVYVPVVNRGIQNTYALCSGMSECIKVVTPR